MTNKQDQVSPEDTSEKTIAQAVADILLEMLAYPAVLRQVVTIATQWVEGDLTPASFAREAAHWVVGINIGDLLPDEVPPSVCDRAGLPRGTGYDDAAFKILDELEVSDTC